MVAGAAVPQLSKGAPARGGALLFFSPISNGCMGEQNQHPLAACTALLYLYLPCQPYSTLGARTAYTE